MSIRLIQNDNRFVVEAGPLTLEHIRDSVVQLSVNSVKVADLEALSLINALSGTESEYTVTGPLIDYDGKVPVICWIAEKPGCRISGTFTCSEDRIVYRVCVAAETPLEDVRFFSGLHNRGSLYRYNTLFTPEVTLLDRRYYKSCEYACIDGVSGLTSERATSGGEDNNHWLFTPPPFAWAWDAVDPEDPSAHNWLSVGLAPEPGQYNFNFMQYLPDGNCFSIRLPYDGKTDIKGYWEPPAIVFQVAEDQYDAIQKAVDYLDERKLVPKPERQQPEWWSRPMFCGWGQQNVTAITEGHPSNRFACQQKYDHFLDILNERNMYPGTIVIDDKWQTEYGTLKVDTNKWPDLRAWIDQRHSEGMKVLLWIGCWSRDGLPDDECILNSDGIAISADPSSPKYQKRIAEAVHQLLSPDGGCFNADGFKVDWTNGLPTHGNVQHHGPEWGIELLKLYYKLYYDAAKLAKPDSLIITHAANPYFRDVTDMLRLNDVSFLQRGMIELMQHRQKLALIADPTWLIDCDNSSAPTVDEWFAYTKYQPNLGVPSLYFITAVDGTGEKIPAELFDQMPEVWRKG